MVGPTKVDLRAKQGVQGPIGKNDQQSDTGTN
jgi:hypothetical protein